MIQYLLGIMDITHQQQSDLTITENKIQKMPKPFSIESLISTRSCSPIVQQSNVSPDSHPMFPSALTPNLCLPNFPIYNPWMGYLAQTTNERLSQFLTNSPEFSHFLENPDGRDKISEMLLNHAANDQKVFFSQQDLTHRERLAQYFANNVRGGNGAGCDPKFTEYLINGKSDQIQNGSQHQNSDSNERFPSIIIGSEKTCGISTHAGGGGISVSHFGSVQNFNQFLVKNDPEKEDDLDSGDSCSELSLTMSPDGSHKNAGKLNLSKLIYSVFR